MVPKSLSGLVYISRKKYLFCNILDFEPIITTVIIFIEIR